MSSAGVRWIWAGAAVGACFTIFGLLFLWLAPERVRYWALIIQLNPIPSLLCVVFVVIVLVLISRIR